jgi:hypothetical protein
VSDGSFAHRYTGEHVMLTFLSLGAGVQSSTLALMAKKGVLAYHIDAAIFADTGAEPLKVYRWLDWLEGELPFPVHRVSAGNLRTDVLSAVRGELRNGHLGQPPFFTKRDDSKAGMLWRKCTKNYKIAVIERKVRELAGLKKGERGPREVLVQQLIGISLDESQRMKHSGKKYIRNIWPLIELGVTRQQCIEWMIAQGYPQPPKSACTFCPYHDDALWRDMKRNDPESWSDAVAVDRAIRFGIPPAGIHAELYLHRSLRPLEEVDLGSDEDLGQASRFDPLGFQNECEGMCGL